MDECQPLSRCVFNTICAVCKKHLNEKGLPAKAVLFIDNAPTHPGEDELKSGNIFCKFLPPNATSIVLSMDQGPIVALKWRYGKILLSELVKNQGYEKDSIADTLKKLTLKVSFMSAAAWVSKKSVKKFMEEVMVCYTDG